MGRRTTDEADAVAGDTDVGVHPRVSGAVHNAAVADENIVLLSEKTRGRQQQDKLDDAPFHAFSVD